MMHSRFVHVFHDDTEVDFTAPVDGMRTICVTVITQTGEWTLEETTTRGTTKPPGVGWQKSPPTDRHRGWTNWRRRRPRKEYNFY